MSRTLLDSVVGATASTMFVVGFVGALFVSFQIGRFFQLNQDRAAIQPCCSSHDVCLDPPKLVVVPDP